MKLIYAVLLGFIAVATITAASDKAKLYPTGVITIKGKRYAYDEKGKLTAL